MTETNRRYITLTQASKMSPYQKGYLSLLCRRKLLKAVKINGSWHTKAEWLNAYLRQHRPDDLISEKKVAQEMRKPKDAFFLFFSLSFATLLLFVLSFFLFQSQEQKNLATESFIPKERTIIIDENGNEVTYETGTRVLGAETER